MISEVEIAQGKVWSRVIRSEHSTKIEVFPSNSNCSYIVNGVGVYIKYSTKRMSPWNFSFYRNHQDEIKKMHDELGKIIVVLVCGADGIASLEYDELKNVLDENHDAVERIGVSRPPRGKYKIVGTNGKLQKSVADSDFPGKIFTTNS